MIRAVIPRERAAITLSVVFLLLGAATVTAQAVPIPRLMLTPSVNGPGPALMVDVNGVEQDPENIVGRWDVSAACRADLRCFLAALVAASRANDFDRLALLQVSGTAMANESRELLRNVTRSVQNAIALGQFVNLIGWVDVGDTRVTMLVVQPQAPARGLGTTTLSLFLRRDAAGWALGFPDDYLVQKLVERIVPDIMRRHPLPTR